MKLSSLSAALFVTISVLPAFGQQASREDFNEFAKAMVGRWVGEVTFITDWPGIGKKGQKTTAYSEIKMTEDGNAFTGKAFGGVGSLTWLTFYDAGNRQIKETGVDSGGTVWVAIHFKERGQWKCQQTGSLPDGSKVVGNYQVAITDNGNTHTWTGSTTVGGKPVDEQRDIFRRVSK